MSLAPRLDLRQSQSLVMTPQLQQAIKLLALSNLEIEAFIAEEVERNPLLETGNPEEAASDVSDALAAGADGPAVLGSPEGDPALDLDYATESHQQDSVADGGYGLDGGLGLSGTGPGGGGEAPDLDAFADTGGSLHDHLLAQLGALVSGLDAVVAGHLVDAIDEADREQGS